MALHRKYEALLTLEPDIAVIGECADPATVNSKMTGRVLPDESAWVGNNRHKGLAVLAYNGYTVAVDSSHDDELDYVLPVLVDGPMAFTLLAVWARNVSGGNYRKDQPGPFRLALDHYREMLYGGTTVVAGDLNNNVLWDRPGWPINHADAVEIMAGYGMVSAYHELRGEQQGQESIPTIYWRDRKKDGPTYHIDYFFLPHGWVRRITEFRIGTFEDWVGAGLSDHVPLVVELR